MRRIQSFLLFGFQGSREAVVAGFNGKMSEYHAAVGLAALDGWDEARQALITRAQAYSKAFRRTNAVRLQRGFGDNWIANTCVVELPDGAAYRIANRLASAEITTRHWWGRGAHAHLATQHFPKSELEVTERLAVSTIGLPFYVDLPLNDVDKVSSEIIAEVSS
jgi:dTDP-4-amino-4,6-dideoxygalactose transaminase